MKKRIIATLSALLIAGGVTAASATVPAPEPTVQSCESQGLLTAEDLSCVPASFYEEPVTAPVVELTQPEPTVTTEPPGPNPCANLQPGDAWAGVGLTCGTPEPTPAATPVPLQEDDPGWNCLIHGNKICGVPISDVADAWASFDGVAVAGVVGQSVGFRVDYVGTTGATSLPGYWVVPSQHYAGTSHVFTITTN